MHRISEEIDMRLQCPNALPILYSVCLNPISSLEDGRGAAAALQIFRGVVNHLLKHLLHSSASQGWDLAIFLPAGHATLLRHGSVLFLEAVAQSLGSLHVLVDASHDAALFTRGERLAFEAVDAGVEALLDQVGVHLGRVMSENPVLIAYMHARSTAYVHKFLHLLLLHAVLELALLVYCESSTRSVQSVCIVPGCTH
jgi:hypothetical protein